MYNLGKNDMEWNLECNPIRVIILIAIVLVVRLVKLVYKLCNFNKVHMTDTYVEQKCCPILGNKSDVFLEVSTIANIIS